MKTLRSHCSAAFRGLICSVLTIGLTAFGVPAGSGRLLGAPTPAAAETQSLIRITQSGPGAHRSLKLGLNKALVVDLPEDAHDILVADPTIADAVTRTSRRIYLFGKKVGQTNIFVFGDKGREIVSLDLEVERDITGLEANLKRFIPDSNIKVEIVSDNVLLTGTVRTPQDSSRAISLAKAFLQGGEATTRNETATSSNASGIGAVAIYAEDRQTSQIVNLLTIEGEDQVMLKVTVAEISRQVLKQLGFSASLSDGSSNITYSNPSNLGNAVDVGGTASLTKTIGRFGISGYINAMEQAGVMRTLAEPTLTAISGEQAKFYVGGEYRLASGQDISTDSDTGKTTVTRSNSSVDYGVQLNFRPVVLSPGRISLAIETDVSEPTFEGSVVNGSGNPSIPGQTYMSIRKREASTTVELPSGGSIVIAGLVQDNIRQAMSGLPGIANIPILGTLFRSKDFVRNESELVIIATPYLVRPVARNDLQRPDDNFNPTGDSAMYFLNRVNKIYGRKEATASGGYQGSVGFIYK
ncbi:type II and III secretion system protein family protein [Allorhizobium sp. BGMRC 0089]|uniref:type II and III secretion system protein family protein n=1 Tax=Allorhizobium sonneratiae TaxID=2934936 RepID=UPI002033C3A0|nr:type II and III secretion system protein family protein [Allorhizobium sonneratiae]MCM2291766.1 type II and III secretion system protein family protein [Allorhizobium sonneratiae]